MSWGSKEGLESEVEEHEERIDSLLEEASETSSAVKEMGLKELSMAEKKKLERKTKWMS